MQSSQPAYTKEAKRRLASDLCPSGEGVGGQLCLLKTLKQTNRLYPLFSLYNDSCPSIPILISSPFLSTSSRFEMIFPPSLIHIRISTNYFDPACILGIFFLPARQVFLSKGIKLKLTMK